METKEERSLNSIRQEKRKKANENLIEFISQHLDYTTYGFHISYHDLERHNPYVALDSEWCRVSFTLDMEQFPRNDTLIIYYGRLHAPNLEYSLVWNSKQCRCWHKVYDALFFLDGFTPEDVVDKEKQGHLYPQAVTEFRNSELGTRLSNEYAPQYHAALHNALWKQYGQRLFEIFDLRRPDLWEQFSQFIKEYYRMKGSKQSSLPGIPRFDEIC